MSSINYYLEENGAAVRTSGFFEQPGEFRALCVYIIVVVFSYASCTAHANLDAPRFALIDHSGFHNLIRA